VTLGALLVSFGYFQAYSHVLGRLSMEALAALSQTASACSHLRTQGDTTYSLHTLQINLDASRQPAQDHFNKPDFAGLLGIERRGFRRTNVYPFVWTGRAREVRP
jgi:hypothetical protein